MYDVLTICRHVIDYCDQKGYYLNNLKLQKLLYFIQAYFLIAKKEPCFDAEIEAWDFGPVVPKAYREYKRFGGGGILSFSEGHSSERIIDDDKAMIDAVLDRFADYSSTDLVELTQHQRPWLDTYEPRKCREIPINLMREYFCD